jgi:hypothetical protein
MEVIASNPEAYGQAVAIGVQRAVSDGSYAKGINKAKQEQRWRKAADKASRNYQAATADAVAAYMGDYPRRKAAIDAVVKAHPAVPGETRDQRIARGNLIQREIGEAMDRLYGRGG